NKKVWHFREIRYHIDTFDVLAKANSERMLTFLRSTRTEHIAECHNFTITIRNFNPDCTLSRNRRKDSDLIACNSIAQVSREARDLLDLHTRAELDLVSGYGRPASVSGHLGIDLKL